MATAISSGPVEGSPKHTAIRLSDVFPPCSQQSKPQRPRSSNEALSLRGQASLLPGRTDENSPNALEKGEALSLQPTSSLGAVWDRRQPSKKRTLYHSEGRADQRPRNTARDRVAQDSVIVAEIKLNCKLEAEQSFLSDISFHLSEIYQRPESCITVSLYTPQAMFFAGSSDPAYLVTITALASQLTSTRNKCNTSLVQGFMYESLDINPKRGVIRFEPTTEENLATNGMTVLQEIERIERTYGDDSHAAEDLSRNLSRRSQKPFPSPFKNRGRTPVPQILRYGNRNSGEDKEARSSEVGELEMKRMTRRKSIMAFFGR